MKNFTRKSRAKLLLTLAIFLMASFQKTSAQTLTIDANYSFFSPVGTLKANVSSSTGGLEYNKGEVIDYVYNWKNLGDTIIFGCRINNSGSLTIKPRMGVPASHAGSKIYVYLDGRRKTVTLSSTGGLGNYQDQNSVTFTSVGAGFHEIKLQIRSLAGSGEVGRLKQVKLSGSAAAGSSREMRRYRPKAVHGKWKTTSNNPVEISVHQVKIVSKKYTHYSPITTPFGYTGSGWGGTEDGVGGFKGYNFSLWSYGQNDPVPPLVEFSHLIAVGPGLEFGEYGHEGTGVKPRGDHPYINTNTNVQTIAVRTVPGTPYNTFWSYYLDPHTGHWKLYGCGRKLNEDGVLKYLEDDMGAFLEVTGGTKEKRSGHRVREVRHKGWQLDTSGNWHKITTLEGGTAVQQLSYRDWDKINNNEFIMKIGGWGPVGTPKETITISNPSAVPTYLQGAYLDELYEMPAEFTHTAAGQITGTSAQLKYNVTKKGANATAEVFWGTADKLTFDYKWPNSKSITIGSGNNTFTLNGLNPNTTYKYRIRIKNNNGITWSMDTQEFTTTGGGSGGGNPIQGLRAHYNFQQNLDDDSSYDRDLSIVGGFTPSYISDHNGAASSAYQAPGLSGNYLVNNGYRGVNGTKARTVTAWFKTNTSGTRKTIVSWGTNAQGQMFNVMIDAGKVRVEGGSCSLKSVAHGLDDNTWHHLAVTYDPVDGDKLKDVKIYIDGVLNTNETDAGASYRSEIQSINTVTTGINVRVGSASYNSNYFWIGGLDDVRIYADAALSASQIQDIVNGAGARTLRDGALVNSKNVSAGDISLYPNPMQDYFSINVGAIANKDEKAALVAIYSLAGTLKLSTMAKIKNAHIDIETKDILPGVYIVRLHMDEISKTFRITKE
ncbi:LamG-like jellyroll fold domain-containing protein [Reichenbachiella sp.]|uniref:DUF3472 domain-containing protein n=1 Tax=Reichenbachiella sp. TaxID=2184521 RepID=UPI003296DD8A